MAQKIPQIPKEIDRSKDVLPPSDRDETIPCKCGKHMIGRIDKSHILHGILHWFWWCGGCGAVVDGGQWHPTTEDEAAYQRWKTANQG